MKHTYLLLMGIICNYFSFSQECKPVYTNFSQCGIKAIAHRGYSHIYPENTLLALEEAFKRGITYAEIDVNTTSDGIAVLFHDQPSMHRTSSSDLYIRNHTYADLKTYDFGSWKGAQFSRTPFATLEEAMLLAERYDAHLYLDTKGFDPKAYQSALNNSGVDPGTIMPSISSISEADSFKAYCPESPFVFFGDWQSRILDDIWILSLINKGCIAFEIYFESAFANDSIFKIFRDKVHFYGAELWVFTTNDPSQFSKLASNTLGIDAIETDKPWEMARIFCENMTPDNTSNRRSTGNWNFQNGNTFGTGIGSQLSSFHFIDSLPHQEIEIKQASAFGLPSIETVDAKVLKIPAMNPGNGLMVYTNFTPKGDADLNFKYTIIMDILVPSTSTDKWISLIQTNPNNSNDGDIFINPEGKLGINNVYHGYISPDEWHRLVISVNEHRIDKYIDGVFIGTNYIEGNRWSLVNTFPGGNKQGFYLGADNDNETADFYISAFQIRNYYMNPTEAELHIKTKATGIQLINTGIYNLKSPDYPIANFITDWSNHSIYITEEEISSYEMELSFALSYGATSNIQSGQTFDLRNDIIRVTAEDTNHYTDWKFCYEPKDPFTINEKQNLEIILYPNPGNGLINLQTQSTNERPQIIFIYNQIGDLLEIKNRIEHELDLSHLPNGIYHITLKYSRSILNKVYVKL